MICKECVCSGLKLSKTLTFRVLHASVFVKILQAFSLLSQRTAQTLKTSIMTHIKLVEHEKTSKQKTMLENVTLNS